MKKIMMLLIAAVLGMGGVSAKDECQIPMMLLIVKAEKAPAAAMKNLDTRLRRAVTQDGIEGGARYSDFCIVASTTESGKEVMSGLRPLITQRLELELFVANNFTGDKYASTSISLSGAGHSEAQAYTAAIASIDQHRKELQDFMAEVKKKLNNYYETHTEEIIKRAKTLSTKHEYEEALCLLSTVPMCTKHYKDVEKAILEIWSDFTEYDCTVKVNAARNIWNASQNKEGAMLAGAYLAAVSPSAKCADDAEDLSEEINKRIGKDIEYAKEMEKDSIKYAREQRKEAIDFMKQQHRDETELEKARIEAGRAIGVAYGENQKAPVIRENWQEKKEKEQEQESLD